MKEIKIPESHLIVFLCDYDNTTMDMVSEYTDAAERLKTSEAGNELLAGMVGAIKFQIIQRVDFILQYKEKYSSPYNWTGILERIHKS